MWNGDEFETGIPHSYGNRDEFQWQLANLNDNAWIWMAEDEYEWQCDRIELERDMNTARLKTYKNEWRGDENVRENPPYFYQ